MSQKYALPCQCGQTFAVDVRQAGETVTCGGCGKPLEVPKLREIRQLAVIQPETATKHRRSWSALEGSLFAGGLLALVIAVGAIGYTYFWKSQWDVSKPDISQIEFRHDIQDIPLTNSWDLWQDYKKKRIDSRPTPYHIFAQNRVAELDRWIWGFGILAVVGGLHIVACAVLRIAR